MARIEYLGMVQTADGRTPTLVRANEEDRPRVAKEVSGDVLFTTAEDMRSLEELLEEHGVLFAVLERSSTSEVAEVSSAVSHVIDWRREARQQLDYNRDIAGADQVMGEDYVFLAMLNDDALADVLVRAYALLDDPDLEQAEWEKFLEDEAIAAEKALGHVPAESEEPPSIEPVTTPPPLLTLDRLSVTFSGSAFGAPRPLADERA